MEGILFFLGIEVLNNRVLFAEVVVLDTAGHDDHHGDGDDQHEQSPRQHFKRVGRVVGVEDDHESNARDDGGDGQGHPQRKPVHEVVIPGGVADPAFLHAAPQQRIHIDIIEVANAKQGVHFREAGAAFPLADGLAGDI